MGVDLNYSGFGRIACQTFHQAVGYRVLSSQAENEPIAQRSNVCLDRLQIFLNSFSPIIQ